MNKNVSKFEKFLVITFAVVILGLLLFASVAVAIIGLAVLPFFIFLKKDRLSGKTKQPDNSIDAEFKRID
jgi:cell division protein FtsL